MPFELTALIWLLIVLAAVLILWIVGIGTIAAVLAVRSFCRAFNTDDHNKE